MQVSKLDAARRQLRTAIRLWFYGGDPVSTHTLACAAYEIIHVVSKKRNPKREELIFDTSLIKKEFRDEVNKTLKSHPNFFKHADKDPEAVIEFHPKLSEFFFIFAIAGIRACGEAMNDEESAFWLWMQLHDPVFLTPEGHKLLAESVPVRELEGVRQTPKHEFLENFVRARAVLARQRGF